MVKTNVVFEEKCMFLRDLKVAVWNYNTVHWWLCWECLRIWLFVCFLCFEIAPDSNLGSSIFGLCLGGALMFKSCLCASILVSNCLCSIILLFNSWITLWLFWFRFVCSCTYITDSYFSLSNRFPLYFVNKT